ncbi:MULTISPECIES: hypothetical protein [unclassified Corallococcus]|uniref:hypothetical protein n=1 Tax=unclassified Corallococcus TaxID=2685029 RepID=UPI001A8E4032|nr:MULTISPECIES: hypothetical protein [unclassified Corallococcus]MBN9685378.1 hypothetical protein [Corallococcus sp. NCSPR001]WAS83171.1 hypothetical protein O0N60_28100 [Corallococcus sp. NCRR]
MLRDSTVADQLESTLLFMQHVRQELHALESEGRTVLAESERASLRRSLARAEMEARMLRHRAVAERMEASRRRPKKKPMPAVQLLLFEIPALPVPDDDVPTLDASEFEEVPDEGPAVVLLPRPTCPQERMQCSQPDLPANVVRLPARFPVREAACAAGGAQ